VEDPADIALFYRVVLQSGRQARAIPFRPAGATPTPPPSPPSPPSSPPAQGAWQRGQPSWAATPEERKRQQEFFKKGLAPLPKGYKGGGFLGIPLRKRGLFR